MAKPIALLPSNIDFTENNKIRPEWYMLLQFIYSRIGGAISQNNNELIVGQLDDAGIEELKGELYFLRDDLLASASIITSQIDELSLAPVSVGYDYNPAAVAITGGTIDSTPIGQTSPAAGSFTTLNSATDVTVSKTITAAGTTGAQTINKTAGSVNFAAVASSVIVTNSLATTSSVILCTVATNDATLKTVLVVAAAGSFTITSNAAATAETRVNFLVIN